ncbi:MAG: Hsp20/alpha crystallin family protein [Nitrospirales bacterium]|nr:Hsp20/alpha crystallin family protein [Nitrospirales bacterium]
MKEPYKGQFFYEMESSASPLIDLYETEDELVFEVDLPGVDPDDVSVGVYEDLLILEGIRRDERPAMQEGVLKYLCLERCSQGFRRVVRIPIPVNTLSAAASYARGVMTIRFPKLKGKLIRISVERQQP